jgi:hypothetical protein
MPWSLSKKPWVTVFLFDIYWCKIDAFKLSFAPCSTTLIHFASKLSPCRMHKWWRMRHTHIMLGTNINATSIRFIKILLWPFKSSNVHSTHIRVELWIKFQ